MQATRGQSGRFVQAEHQVHVLNPHMSAALTDAIQNAENHNAAAGFIHIQADIRKVSAGHAIHPGIRFVLPGGFFFFRQVINLYEILVFIEFFIECQ